MTFTYWYKSDRGFQNEYDVGIACTMDARGAYRKQGYERIDRTRAIRELRYKGDAATQPFVSVSIDAYHFAAHLDRFEIARLIKDGGLPAYVRGLASRMSSDEIKETARRFQEVTGRLTKK